jgi:hypothetical protein
MKFHFFVYIIATLVLTACGEFAYKRGASATDLQQAKKECSNASNEALAENCMKERGWNVQNLDNMDLFATASYTDSNPNQTPNSKLKEEAKSVAPLNKPDESISKKASNPLDLYTVNSWWKMGANGQNLEVAIQECVTTLGEGHRPNSKTQQVTRGLAICMREKGWRGLKTQS